MMDGNPGTPSTTETEQTPKTDYTWAKAFACGAIVATVIVLMLVWFSSTGRMKIPDMDMIPGMLSGVCTANQVDMIEESIDHSCVEVDVDTTFTYYDITVYERGYKGDNEHTLAMIGFHWDYVKRDFVIDEFEWVTACPCGCDNCIAGGYEK